MAQMLQATSGDFQYWYPAKLANGKIGKMSPVRPEGGGYPVASMTWLSVA